MHEIIDALRADFADLAELGEVTHLAVRLVFAILLGGLLGYEREYAGKAAGMRTHMLVAFGAALFVMIPAFYGVPKGDMSRVIQGVATGIGFIGGGTILKLTDARQIKGLTTAAGIWLTAAIGVAVGLGRLGTALLGTLLALVILSLLSHLEPHVPGDDG